MSDFIVSHSAAQAPHTFSQSWQVSFAISQDRAISLADKLQISSQVSAISAARTCSFIPLPACVRQWCAVSLHIVSQCRHRSRQSWCIAFLAVACGELPFFFSCDAAILAKASAAAVAVPAVVNIRRRSIGSSFRNRDTGETVAISNWNATHDLTILLVVRVLYIEQCAISGWWISPRISDAIWPHTALISVQYLDRAMHPAE
ncbi:MAG: hypothetical protein R3C19_08725 [Planctomycetaceae bacterium]